MKKQTAGRFFGILTVVLWLTAAILIPFTEGSAEDSRPTVVLDPGHGGEDGGAVADDGTLEKDLNLSISLRLKELLEQQGIRVIMTRTTDDDTDGVSGFHKRRDLEFRATTGNDSEADLYVSIHVNASRSDRDQGFQVWYGTGNPEGEQTANHLTERVKSAGICTRVRAVKPVPETLYIFRTVKIPSVLVECGFISNATDLYRLKQESFREELCNALCGGIVGYLSGKSSEMM